MKKCKLIGRLLLCATVTSCATQKTPISDDRTAANAWWQSGQEALKTRKALTLNKNRAKNVILFIGDGMGISTVTAARIFDGQSRGEPGEENVLSFESFPHVALIKTYNVDAQVPDSAGTASAMNTGIKTRFRTVSIWNDQPPGDCFGPQKDFPRTLAEIGESLGMSTGVVTTDKVTYATPAAVYAHAPSRKWEDDSKLPETARSKGCQDIAQQLVNFPHGDGLDVILGGGRESLLPKSAGGNRLDNRNLIEEWQGRHPGGKAVHTAGELRSLSAQNTKTEKLLGLFAPGHLSYSAEKDKDKEPTLAEMTSTAIDLLDQRPNGYFLMVENGHIDHGHHETNAYLALTDAQAFAQAVETALSKVDLNETLVLVTADHSHPLTIVGYPVRGNPILGLVRPAGSKGQTKTIDGFSIATDGKPFSTLGYRAGPSARNTSSGISPAALNTKQQTAIPMPVGSHGGEDVALYATGPRAHLVGGVLEQNSIFHIIGYALGWFED